MSRGTESPVRIRQNSCGACMTSVVGESLLLSDYFYLLGTKHFFSATYDIKNFGLSVFLNHR